MALPSSSTSTRGLVTPAPATGIRLTAAPQPALKIAACTIWSVELAPVARTHTAAPRPAVLSATSLVSPGTAVVAAGA